MKKKILCLIIAAMMLATVTSAEDVTENDVTEETSVEDVIDVEDTVDSEPEDTPDEAPVDLAEEPPEVIEEEPEDTPDASPDDDDYVPAPAMLAASSCQADTWYSVNDNVQWIYESDTQTLRFRGNGSIDSNLIVKTEWEKFMLQGWGDSDDIVVKNIVIEEGITYIGAGAFNRFKTDVNIYLPSTLTGVGYGAFGNLITGFFGQGSVMAYVNYGGTDEQWTELEKNIADDNDGISLKSTTYFQTRIPDVINLSNTDDSYTFTMYKAQGLVVAVDAYFSNGKTETTLDCGTNYTGTGNNECYLSVNINGDQCVVSAVGTDDYQDYSCSDTLTFEFGLGKLSG